MSEEVQEQNGIENNNLEKSTDLEDNNNYNITEKVDFILEMKIILKNVEIINDDINIRKKKNSC